MARMLHPPQCVGMVIAGYFYGLLSSRSISCCLREVRPYNCANVIRTRDLHPRHVTTLGRQPYKMIIWNKIRMMFSHNATPYFPYPLFYLSFQEHSIDSAVQPSIAEPLLTVYVTEGGSASVELPVHITSFCVPKKETFQGHIGRITGVYSLRNPHHKNLYAFRINGS